MRFTFLIFSLFLTFISCKDDEVLTIVEPLDYFPAYPGSVWYYSNGEVSKVHTAYVEHSYQANLGATDYTEKKLVPFIDGEYLYGYEITQNSNAFPLKKLLSETVTDPWLVDTTGSDFVNRATIQKLDSLHLDFSPDEPYIDSTYTDIVVVVEFLGSLSAAEWHRKEFYAKNVGLIQVEVNDPYDTVGAIIQKKLVEYKINK